MIRFIDLGKQIAQDKDDPDWPREFCFYDTLQASFLSFGNQQIFDSRQDLLDNVDDSDPAYLRRIVKLLPEWVPSGNKTIVR